MHGALQLRVPVLVAEGAVRPAVRLLERVELRLEDLVLRVDLELVVVLVVAVGSGSTIISTVSFVQSFGWPAGREVVRLRLRRP